MMGELVAGVVVAALYVLWGFAMGVCVGIGTMKMRERGQNDG